MILFGQNIVGSEQVVRLVLDLQSNNAQGADEHAAQAVTYFVAADQEGGSVARLRMGTRGTGSMAIGTTGKGAEENALATGRVFGEVLAALGINVDLGPCVVITDLFDTGMSTRVFCDDPVAMGALGNAFAEGLGEHGVVADALEMEQFFVEPDTGAAILPGQEYALFARTPFPRKGVP